MNHPVLINHGTHTLIDVIKTPIFDAYGEPSPYFARLLTFRYYCADGIQHYDKLEIELHDKDKYYFTFARNSPNIPPMMYVKQNNQDFIITSGDYQCISIYNITTKQFTDYIYKDDRDYIHFRGFCPLEYKWTEESQTLTITGQVPYGPKEIMLIHNIDLNNISFSNIEWDDYYKDEGEE